MDIKDIKILLADLLIANKDLQKTMLQARCPHCGGKVVMVVTENESPEKPKEGEVKPDN